MYLLSPVSAPNEDVVNMNGFPRIWRLLYMLDRLECFVFRQAIKS